MKKIKKKQLEKLQDFIKSSKHLQSEIGSVEFQKSQLLQTMHQLNRDLKEFQKELEQEYGQVTINIEDGTISKNED